MPDTKIGTYCECFVAYLDVLGFSDLIQQSTIDFEILKRLVATASAASGPVSGQKGTSLGPVWVQARAFSDSIVLFTPTPRSELNARYSEPLTQLLFMVRYLHDQMLENSMLLRGAVSCGSMYWHPEWSDADRCRLPRSSRHPPLTLGPALIDAYRLESETRGPPRVLIHPSTVAECDIHSKSHPFAQRGKLSDYFIHDSDGVLFLDILNRDVTRFSSERMSAHPTGFTVEWSDSTSCHPKIIHLCEAVAQTNMATIADKNIRVKYEWLASYADRSK